MSRESWYQTQQALEKEMKEAFVKIAVTTAAGVAPAGTTSGLNAEITYTSATVGVARNADTITIQVIAAAANPTDTVLLVVSGTINAVVLTVTPNDGTNNSATSVEITTAQLVLALNGKVSAVYDSINVTITDSSSLLTDLTSTGGDATDLIDSGEGDNVAATLINGAAGPTLASGQVGLSSVSRVSAGKYKVTFKDTYVSIKSFAGMVIRSTSVDHSIQLVDDTVGASKDFNLFINTASTATDLLDGDVLLLKLGLKNLGV